MNLLLTFILHNSILHSSMVFAELDIFNHVLADHLSEENFRKLQNELINKPKSGDVIQGTGGARKVRFSLPGRGKRGGCRVIYFYAEEIEKAWFIAIYGKNVKENISPEDKKNLKYIIQVLKSEVKKSKGGRK